jgi:hypothetical protein
MVLGSKEGDLHKRRDSVTAPSLEQIDQSVMVMTITTQVTRTTINCQNQ